MGQPRSPFAAWPSKGESARGNKPRLSTGSLKRSARVTDVSDTAAETRSSAMATIRGTSTGGPMALSPLSAKHAQQPSAPKFVEALKVAFKEHRDKPSQPRPFSEGNWVADTSRLPEPLRSAPYVFAFTFQGRDAYFTSTRERDHFGQVEVTLYDAQALPLARAKQYAEDEGGVLNWF